MIDWRAFVLACVALIGIASIIGSGSSGGDVTVPPDTTIDLTGVYYLDTAA